MLFGGTGRDVGHPHGSQDTGLQISEIVPQGVTNTYTKQVKELLLLDGNGRVIPHSQGLENNISQRSFWADYISKRIPLEKLYESLKLLEDRKKTVEQVLSQHNLKIGKAIYPTIRHNMAMNAIMPDSLSIKEPYCSYNLDISKMLFIKDYPGGKIFYVEGRKIDNKSENIDSNRERRGAYVIAIDDTGGIHEGRIIDYCPNAKLVDVKDGEVTCYYSSYGETRFSTIFHFYEYQDQLFLGQVNSIGKETSSQIHILMNNKSELGDVFRSLNYDFFSEREEALEDVDNIIPLGSSDPDYSYWSKDEYDRTRKAT